MLTLLVYFAIFVIVLIVVFWLLGQIPAAYLPDPIKKVITIAVVIIAVVIVIVFLLSFAGGGGLPPLR